MISPKEVIAYWLWTQLDQIDLDDAGEQAGQDILDALNKAGFKVMPHRSSEQPLGPPTPESLGDSSDDSSDSSDESKRPIR